MAPENFTGKVEEIMSKINSDTVEHADEISEGMLIHENLRDTSFLTADFALWYEQDGMAYLSLARREANPWLLLPFEEVKKRYVKGRFRLNSLEIAGIKSASHTITVPGSALGYTKEFDDSPVLRVYIDPDNWERELGGVDKMVAERGFGSMVRENGNPSVFDLVMKYYSEKGTGFRPSILTYDPDFIEEKLKEGAFGTCCALQTEKGNPMFSVTAGALSPMYIRAEIK